MKNSNKIFDELGRIVSDHSPSIGTITTYEYGHDWRRITMTNERNISNHTTVIEQNSDGNGGFIDAVKTEDGNVYTMKTIYDENGKEVRYERINKLKKTNLIKTTYHSKNGKTCVFIINHDGKEEIGFKADVKRLRPNIGF